MKYGTSISWCTSTLNLQKWHCVPASAGCKNCYALALGKRYPANVSDKPELANMPARLRKLARFNPGEWVFMADMYDYLLKDTPMSMVLLHHVLPLLRPDVNFMVLTKRPQFISDVEGICDDWPDNLWFGVTIENMKETWRLKLLKEQSAQHRFISFEPLLEDVSDGMDLKGINFAIVGGESGTNRRSYDKQWARNIEAVCNRDNAVFHHKQGSAFNPGKDYLLVGRELRPLPDGTCRDDCKNEIEKHPVRQAEQMVMEGLA